MRLERKNTKNNSKRNKNLQWLKKGKEDQQFTYMYYGSIISKTGDSNEDIETRISRSRQTFAELKPVWVPLCYVKAPRGEYLIAMLNQCFSMDVKPGY